MKNLGTRWRGVARRRVAGDGCWVRVWWPCVVAVLVMGGSECAARDAFSTYGSAYRAFGVPPVGSGSFGVAGDALADGRVVTVTGLTVFVERGVGQGVFDALATLDASFVGGAVDPAFLRVSPDGSSIAIGAGFNKPVAVFATSELGAPGMPRVLTGGAGGVARYFNVPHFEGAWADSSHLALTAGDFGAVGFVSLLDVTSAASAPVNPTVVQNIGGASAGVAFDAAGRLYTGNGFDLDEMNGSRTGTIRAFAHDEWSMGSANFETGGTPIGEVLSAGSLGFDAEGNLFVGGGDFGGDSGYLGVVNHSALADAIAGLGPVDSGDVTDLRRLDPLGNGLGYFGSVYNRVTGELVITSGTTWYATVPGPGGGVLVGIAVVCRCRRRRGGKGVAHE